MTSTTRSQASETRAVLLCAGDRDLRLALAGLLERTGCRVLVASDSRQALSTAMSAVPDCILLDLPLPGGEPAEVLRGLRSLPGSERIPVVLLAPRGQGALAEDGFRPGLDQRLPRTAPPGEVLQAVLRALES